MPIIVPKEGEKLPFSMYDQPEGKVSGTYCLKVKGAISIHGIRGVEIASQYIGSDDGQKEESTIFAQLTEKVAQSIETIADEAMQGQENA